ncbi:MAG: GTP pyrophosphokinase [Candidatus Moranbacteria bacterium]|nr:GTP pyrophosphokinase [Candidatus Moranbacteria bacterium]
MSFRLKQYLKKLKISQKEFDEAGLKVKELILIKKDFKKYKKELEPLARYIVKQLHHSSKVHSIRYRVKDEDSLIAKIIRKRIEDPKRKIDCRNYKKEVTDLIGVRVLHLFKEDWQGVHDFICRNWNFYNNFSPIAYYKQGDLLEMIEEFEKRGLEVKLHPYGYRSIHYLVESKPGKEVHIAEIQIRTIFEEAWSEIDHTVRYPDNLGDSLLEQYLTMFNGLVGSADQMGSYVVKLKRELLNLKKKYSKDREEKLKLIKELKFRLKESRFDPEELKDLEGKLDDLIKIPIVSPKAVLDGLDYAKLDFEKEDLINILEEENKKSKKDPKNGNSKRTLS